MDKDDRGYTETQARPDTFDRQESYGKESRNRLKEAEQLSAAESTRAIAKGCHYGRTEKY
jgi:hypothetical protein